MPRPTLILSLIAIFAILTFTSAQAAQPFGIVDGGIEWVDVMHGVDRYSAISGTLSQDKDGWPQNDFHVILFDERHNMPWNGPDPDAVNPDISGTYHLSFTGQATIQAGSEDPAAVSIQHQNYNPATNQTTADMIIAPYHWLVGLTFTQTRRLPSDSLGNGLTNLKLIRPGYPADTHQLFTTPMLKAYSIGFSAIRMLGIDGANDYQNFSGKTLIPVQWADRPKVTDAYQGGTPTENDGTSPGHQGHGTAWEYIIQLCNLTHHDLWLNLPAGATDDYVEQLAHLLKNGNANTKPLDPNLHIYVEYSNEVWNFSFPQYIYNSLMAQNEVSAGHSVLNNDGSTDTQAWAARRYAERLKQISDLFGQVYGESAINHTVRPVFLWQYDTGYASGVFGPGTDQVLAWFDRTYGAPSRYFYGLGIAPYYGPSDDANTVSDISDTLWTGSDATRTNFIIWQTLATYHGLHQVGYESGPSLGTGPAATVARGASMTRSLTHHFLDNWFAVGGDQVCFFTLRGGVSRFGDWMLIEDYTKLATPRMAGARAILAAPQPALTAGYVLPFSAGQSVTVDASQYAQSSQAPGSNLSLGSDARPQDYLLRAVYAGTYSIVLAGTQDNSDLHETLSIDDHQLGTIQLPMTTGKSAAFAIKLAPGFHTLRLSMASGGSGNAHPSAIQIALTQGGGKPVVPSAPGRLQVSHIDNGSLTLQWPNSTTATGYTVLRSDMSGGPYQTVGKVTTNRMTETGLTNGKTYYYVVTAHNSAGTSAYSPQLAGVATHANAPAAPTDLKATLARNGVITLTWQRNADADRYAIYRSNVSGSGYTNLTPSGLLSPVFTDGVGGPSSSNDLVLGNGNANGQALAQSTYYYLVTATNTFGESAHSQEIAVTPQYGVPNVPTQLTATTVNGQIMLRWMPSEDLTPQFGPPQYSVYRSTTATGDYALIAQTSVDNLQDMTASPGKTYYYAVTASNGTGESGRSGTVSAHL